MSLGRAALHRLQKPWLEVANLTRYSPGVRPSIVDAEIAQDRRRGEIVQLHVKEFSGVALPPPAPDQHLTLTVTIYDDAKAELYHTATCELGSVAALCSDASSAAAVPPGHVLKNIQVNAAFVAHHDSSPSRHFVLELSIVQRNSRGVELQCTSLGWTHLPLKPVPNITALPLFLGSPRRIYTLNPLGLGNLHNSLHKMGSVAAASTAVLASAADIGHQALQELLPELFIICASHGAHLNQVPGIRVRYNPAAASVSFAPAFRADILVKDAVVTLPHSCSDDVTAFMSGDFAALYGEAASLKHFEIAFVVHNGRNIVQLLPPVTLSLGATALPELTLKNVHLDTGIVLVALVRAVLVFTASPTKTSAVGVGWLPLPLSTCSCNGAVLTGAIEATASTAPLPPALCCPIPGHSHFILKASAGAAVSLTCNMVCVSDDESMPITSHDAMGVPSLDDFADDGDSQHQHHDQAEQQLHMPAEEDVIEDSAVVAPAVASAPPQRPPPPVAPRRPSPADIPPPASAVSSSSSSSSSSAAAATAAAPASVRPQPPVTSRPPVPPRPLPHAAELEALMHVTFSFELRGALQTMQVDNDQPFSDFRKLLVARAGRGFHLVANIPDSQPLALTSESAFDDCINRVIEDTRAAKALGGIVPCSLVQTSLSSAPSSVAADDATPRPSESIIASARTHSRRHPAVEGSSSSAADAAAASLPLSAVAEGSLPPSPPAVGTASESMHSPRTEFSEPSASNMPVESSSISRALKARLFSRTIVDLIPDVTWNVPVASNHGLINCAAEESCALQTSQVVFHIVGVSTCTPVQRCYFTLRFFHFPLAQTTCCALVPDGPQPAASSRHLHPASLKCEKSGRDGATLCFVVDCSSTSAIALPSSFAQYCHSHCAELSVFDADAHMLIGVARIKLEQLPRGGSSCGQTSIETTVWDTLQSGKSSPCGQVYLRLINIGRPQGFAPACGLYSVKEEQAAGVQLIEPLIGAPSAMSGLSGHSLSKSFEADAQSVTPQAQEALQWLYVHRQQLSKSFNGQSAMPVDSFSKLLLSELKVFPPHLTQPLCRLLERWSKLPSGGINAAQVLRSLRLQSFERFSTGAGSDSSQDDCDAMLQGCIKKHASVTAAFASAAPSGRMTKAALLKLSQELRIGIDDARCSDIIRLASLSSSSSSAATSSATAATAALSLSEFSSLFSVQLAESTDENSRSASEEEARRLLRWQALQRKRNEASQSSQSQPIIQHHDAQLRAVQALRSIQRQDTISSAIKGFMTHTQVVRPRPGDTCFFVHRVRNSMHGEASVTMAVSHPNVLSVVGDRSEFLSLAQANKVAGERPPECDLVDNEGRLYVQAGEEVALPFKLSYTDFRSPAAVAAAIGEAHVLQGPHGCMPMELTVSFTRKGDVKPFHVLRVVVLPQPFVADRVLRLFQPQHEYMKKRIKLDVATNKQAAAAFTGNMVAWSDHPDVQVTCSPHDDDVSVQDVLVKHRVGDAPGVTTFHIVTYADNHRAQVIERWVLEITACVRIDLKAVVGAASSSSFVLRAPAASAEALTVCTSHPAELTVTPSSLTLAKGAIAEATATLLPQHSGKRMFIVNVLSGSQLCMVYALHASVSDPVINKTYAISSSVGRALSKKIVYTNPFGSARRFKLRCTQSHIVELKESLLELQPNAQGFIQLKVLPQPRPFEGEALVFINDDGDATEEVLAIKVSIM